MAESAPLLTRKSENWTVTLLSDDDRLHLYLQVRYRQTPLPLPDDLIPKMIRELELQPPQEEMDRLQNALAEFGKKPRSLEEALLLSGIPPVPGKDAEMTWHIDVSEKTFEEETASVDHHEVRRFVNVREGDVLFVVGETKPGKGGTDIFGKSIPSRDGNPRPVESGPGTAYLDDDRTCVARQDGAIHLHRGIISVENVFSVDGDVDYSVGNIDFNGTVRVNGNVLDGFTIRSTKDVFINGNIEAARVEATGNVVILGGITAREKGGVRAAGSVEAKYINGADVAADGDILVRGEIVNSTCRSGGNIVVLQGSIIGGTAGALEQVNTRQLGSPMNVRTRVLSGVDLMLELRLEDLEEEKRRLNRSLQVAEEKAGPIINDSEKLAALPAGKRDILRKLVRQMGELRKRLEEIDREQESLAKNPPVPNDPRIRIRKRIYSNVDLKIGKLCRTQVTEELDGPFILRPNPFSGMIETESGTSLLSLLSPKRKTT